MMLFPDGDPITPGTIPLGVCQPPVDAMAILGGLSERELRAALQSVIVWVPEVFEQGLRAVSRLRADEGRTSA